MLYGILQIIVILVVLSLLAVPLGRYLVWIFEGERHLLPERMIYRLLGIRPDDEMGWKRYSLSLLSVCAASMLLGYLVLRLQALLPLDTGHLPPQDPDQAFNTSSSFVTTTNWQSYAGEVSLSYLEQMLFVTFMQVFAPATGLAAAAAVIRGLSRSGLAELGNFWVDLTRIILRLQLPLSFLLALVLVWQGVPQTLSPSVVAHTLQGGIQEIARGPVASLDAIKHLGNNGGGYFNANSAHPYEDPTPLTGALQILAMLLITASVIHAFGRMLSRERQGVVFFAVFLVLLVGSVALIYSSEQAGNPLLSKVGADQTPTSTQSGGNMEGKEVRFGISQSSLFTAVTTGTQTGSVDNMHDSLTPLGGLGALINMQLNAVFGGEGVGFVSLLTYAILAVFIVGLMVGRSPEFLGKKIDAREITLVVVSLLIYPASILGFTALAMVWPGSLNGLGNPGAHGFSEVLYAFTSGTENNGSAFAGLSADTPFYNTTIGLAMLAGRYLPLVPLLAVAGSLAGKGTLPETKGTFSTATPLFGATLIGVILIIGGLTFFPSWALGPLAEEFQMLAGKTF
ncbi:potassium-transporting ATPase subunit KdpA [Rubrobacter calidifluminis]|uniref:potassium-transporting ATPase subunit KdpA n=1 Tax=Rubrobacter calidifluminis TaxID=1392640 RepID=UPI00235E5165|nr:potassium-transporting ATPase subunit KdpA [Rubrobacter calidifluminis]